MSSPKEDIANALQTAVKPTLLTRKFLWSSKGEFTKNHHDRALLQNRQLFEALLHSFVKHSWGEEGSCNKWTVCRVKTVFLQRERTFKSQTELVTHMRTHNRWNMHTMLPSLETVGCLDSVVPLCPLYLVTSHSTTLSCYLCVMTSCSTIPFRSCVCFIGPFNCVSVYQRLLQLWYNLWCLTGLTWIEAPIN